MKFLLLFLIPLNILAQTSSRIDNFSMNNGEVIWEAEFPTSLSFYEFKKQILLSGLIEHPETVDSSLAGKTIKISPNYKGAGFSAMSAPIVVSNNFVQGYIVLDYKGGKYRVTLKKMYTVQKSDVHAGILSSRMGEEYPLEFWALDNKKKYFRNNFKKGSSKILNYTFMTTFAL